MEDLEKMYDIDEFDEFIEKVASYDVPVFEADDFISIDMNTGIVKVDKSVFDNFVENSYIEIYCPDINANYIMQFVMISEDSEGITMEWIDSISI